MVLAKQVAALPPAATCKCNNLPSSGHSMPLAHVCDAAHFPNRALDTCCGEDLGQLCNCSGEASERRFEVVCSCCRATQLSRPGRGVHVHLCVSPCLVTQDREVALAAVQQDGRALHFASDELKGTGRSSSPLSGRTGGRSNTPRPNCSRRSNCRVATSGIQPCTRGARRRPRRAWWPCSSPSCALNGRRTTGCPCSRTSFGCGCSSLHRAGGRALREPCCRACHALAQAIRRAGHGASRRGSSTPLGVLKPFGSFVAGPAQVPRPVIAQTASSRKRLRARRARAVNRSRSCSAGIGRQGGMEGEASHAKAQGTKQNVQKWNLPIENYH